MPEIAGIGIMWAFLAGVVSFLSPCVLPLVPGYVSYVAGRSLDRTMSEVRTSGRFAFFGLSYAFVLGFSAVFVTLGASASAIGRLLLSYRYEAGYLAGGLIIVFGLHMMGLLRIGWMNREFRFAPEVGRGRPVGAFVLGAAFGFGWTPCIGPVLGAILTVSATTMGVSDGAVLLLIYSMGLGVPFLLVAAFTDRFMANVARFRRIGRSLHVLAGAILVVVGILMATGYLFSFGTWMLEAFPIFQEIQI